MKKLTALLMTLCLSTYIVGCGGEAETPPADTAPPADAPAEPTGDAPAEPAGEAPAAPEGEAPATETP